MLKVVRKMQETNAAAQAAVYTKIAPELLDQIVQGPMTAEAVEGYLRSLKKALIERALGAELSHRLGDATRCPIELEIVRFEMLSMNVCVQMIIKSIT